jgi:hypothetical protein
MALSSSGSCNLDSGASAALFSEPFIGWYIVIP